MWYCSPSDGFRLNGLRVALVSQVSKMKESRKSDDGKTGEAYLVWVIQKKHADHCEFLRRDLVAVGSGSVGDSVLSSAGYHEGTERDEPFR